MNVTIVELPEFIRRSDNLLTSDERDALVFYLSMHPQAGSIVRGCGGRKETKARAAEFVSYTFIMIRACHYFY